MQNTETNNTQEAVNSVPHNLEVEAALLSAILLDSSQIENVNDVGLQPEHFFAPHNNRLYDLMKQMTDKGQVVTVSTLRHIVEGDETLKEKGLEYIAELATNANPLLGRSAEYYAETLLDLFRKRQIITLANKMSHAAHDMSDLDSTADVQIEAAEETLFKLSSTENMKRSTKSLDDALKSALSQTAEAMVRDRPTVGVATDFADIDAKLGGFYPTDLIILAGRPAMGKTALATNIAYNAARMYHEKQTPDSGTITEGGRVLFFSLEMSANQLALRILGAKAQVSSEQMRKGMIGQKDMDNLTGASVEIAGLPFWIDDTPALSVSAIRQRARRWIRTHNINFIIIDYLQLLQATAGKRHENRVNEIGDITRNLKAIAKELNLPVLCLSQLSREVEKREDKRPQLADLRDSGTIEQDADIVMFLYREEYYLQNSEPVQGERESDAKLLEREAKHFSRLEEVKNKAQLIIAKQRHGATGVIDLHFNPSFTKFSNLQETFTHG